MTQTEKFHDTISILVKAYLNDTLQRSDCTMCAVGNIIEAHGIKPTGSWQRLNRENDKSLRGLKEIEATGYTPSQIDLIERAFMGWGDRYSFDEWRRKDFNNNFNALLRVVDVLAEIHGIDLEQKESAKLMFVK